MRLVFIGCVEFSYLALRHIMTLKGVEVAGVVTLKSSAFNSDFHSLERLAQQSGVPCFLADEGAVSMAAWLREIGPDAVYCFGWSRLLKEEILRIPRLGVIGYHPAALPMNRGRHPIIWALALGLEETASTFFFMDEGADSGDILSQRKVQISKDDDASTLYGKLSSVALEQITGFTEALALNKFNRAPQDHAIANYWRKRSKEDGKIDWRMSAVSIHNLVRALTRPYPGAHCVYMGEDVKIWTAMPVLFEHDITNIEPGKVLRAEGENIFIKCGEGALKLTEHEFTVIPKEGTYL